MGWSLGKPKRKKQYPSNEFRNLKGSKRERFIAERKSKGLTQAQLGEIVGCSASMISAIESGRVKPGLEVSMKLEMALETSFLELFCDL
ncbi:helix-turn-helix domain-containing protein [Lysinibacillus capsici]|uniref:helix-turn-helix domain-containing protein n=1 Tax=Lysinibacillus capsici TaxID=2115968 RepID=UPI0028AF2FCC|nr:helix-turn-helix transcriptional regulator [Lysinibacillus capsici]